MWHEIHLEYFSSGFLSEFFEMKFLCALLGSSLANRAEICDKNDIKCREKSDNKSMFILNNFNDWFQLNQPPVLLKWVGKEDSKAILRNYKQDPAFLVDDSCSVVFNNEMLRKYRVVFIARAQYYSSRQLSLFLSTYHSRRWNP